MIEMEAGIFNTSNSNLWTKLQRVFEAEIKAEYSKMRQAKFTEENLMKYLYGEQISQIPQRNYNLDMQNKYLNFGNQFLHACHGNGYSHMKRWVRERLFFLDTLLDYTITSADYITIRANKLGSVYLDIQTYVPMYARVKWRDEANNTGTQIKKINRGETVRFTYTMPTATDQEVIVYGGKYLKDVGDLTNLQPTTLLISKAPKLTRLVCTNNPNLINTDLSSCTLLQEIDLHGCTQLGGGIGSNPTLNVQKCTNLRRINIYDTQLTAIYTNTSGGNLQEINYPFTVQTVQIHNQPNLKSIGIPVYFINNGNENNRFANKLVSVDIANCENLTSMVKNYYEVNGQPVPVPTFLGVSSAQSFKISNSLTDLERIDLSYCANLRSLSISDFYKLTEINFDDICAWDANYSNLSEIIITNCPYVETMTFNQNTLDGPNSLGVAFAHGMTLDLSNLLNLKHIRSNVGVKGLKRIIVPPTVTSLVFDYPEDTRYSQQLSDIESIWSIDALYAHENDEYKGIDLRGMDTITDFSMGSLASIDNADNLNIKITNTFPYFNYFRNSNFFKPTGTVNISDYKGSLAYLFKGIDMDKLEIICDKQLTQTDAKYMFAYASCSNEDKIVTLFSKMQNITNLSYMFYNAFIRKAPLLPLSTTDCRYMFYNCSTMTETPANWLRSYMITPQSDYCYTGCVNINMIDGEPDTLDSIPSAWGGFGRSNVAYSGYEINATNTLEREIETATISGLSLMNIAPEYGVTPKMEDNQSSFPINNGIDQKILIKEAEYETAILKGHSLTNLVKEKGETQEFERLTETFKMTDGLDLGVEVIDGEFIEAKLHGNTLQNIVVEDGKTSEITNVTQSFNIDNNISDGELVADGDYASMVIKGNTLTNIVPRYGQSDPVEITGTVNVNDVVSEDIVTCDGEMEKAVVKGVTKYTSVNGLVMSDVHIPPVANDGYLNIGNGEIVESEGSKTTDYVSVPTSTFKIRGNNQYKRVCFYDTDKVFVKGDGSHINNNFNDTGLITPPTNAKYMKISFALSGTGSDEVIQILNSNNDKMFVVPQLMSVVSPTLKTTNNKYTFSDFEIIPNSGDAVVKETYKDDRSVTLTATNRWARIRYNVKHDNNVTYNLKFDYNATNSFVIDFNGYMSSRTPIDSGTGSFSYDFIAQSNEIIHFAFPGGGTVEITNIEFGLAELKDEPYKSNILSCNEEVELCAVGDVKDELNLLTGEMTKRFGVAVMDGSDDEVYIDNWDPVSFVITVNNPIFDNIKRNSVNITFDKYVYEWVHGDNTGKSGFYWHGNNLWFRTPLENLGGSHTQQAFKTWLQSNPITIIYELDTPITKAISTSIVDQDGNNVESLHSYKDGYITTSSSQLSPTLSCTIPTSNYFPTPLMTSNTQYTLYFDNEVSSVNVGGNEVTSPTSPMIVTSGSQKNVKFNGEPTNVMLFKGDVRDQTINYFTGSRNVENVKVVNESSRNLWGLDDIQEEKINHNGFTHSVSKYIRVYEGEVLYFNLYPNQYYTFARFYDANYQTITTLETTFEGNYDRYKSSIIVPENSRWMKILVRDNMIPIKSMMVNRGTDFLPYEECRSYQVNNLYLPPSLTLRSNGNVRDEYNPFTSQFTQRIGEDGSVLSSPVTTTVKSIVAYDGMVRYGDELPDKTTDLFHPQAQKYEQVIDLGTLNGTENWTKVNQYVFTIPFTNAKVNTSTDVLTQKDQVESISIDGSTLTLTFKSDSYVGGNNIAVNALKIWLQSNNVQFKYELKNHILTDMTLEEFDFENAHFVKPQAYKNGVVTQSNKDNLIFASMTYQTKSNNRYELPLLESNSEYTLRYKGSANQVTLGGSTNSSIENNCLVQSGSSNKVVLFNDEVSNVMLIKGDVREQTIPYFRGLLSTQMPVLRTYGRNLFDEQYQNLSDFEYDVDSIQLKTNKRLVFQNPVKLYANTTYIGVIEYSGGCASRGFGFNDINQSGIYPTYRFNPISSSEVKVQQIKITPTSDTWLVSIHNGFDHSGVNSPKLHKVAIFESSNLNEVYEPHKSNILSCNEEVTLHSIGDVCDTLDCKTGKLVQNIGEVVLDGSENWEKRGNTNSFWTYNGLDNLHCVNSQTTINCLCDMMESKTFKYAFDSTAIPNSNVGVVGCSGNKIAISFGSTTSKTLEQFKQELSLNPITVQYKLESPIVKTVDLSIVDQDNQPIEQMNYFTDYYGEIKSDGTLPRLTYKLQSTNTFAVPQLKPNTLYTMYSEGEATVATLGGKASILLQNPQTVTSGSTNKSLTFDSATSRVILIESDVRNQVIPYFTGTLDVINPIIKTTSGSKTNTVNTNVKLRSVGDVRDTYDLKTGILTKRISDDHTILDNPQTQTISVTKPVSYNGATVELSSNTTSLLPYFEYSCKSPNYYQAPIESGEIYTVKFNKTSNGTLTMGGVTANTTGNQVITTKNSDVKAILFSGDLGISDLMIMKTDVRNVPTPYFRGLKDVVNPTITVSDGNRTSNSVSITATMRSLPNGTKDELNLVTGEFVQRVGQRNYEDGDSNGPSMITDGTTTLYQLPTVKRSNLSLSWSNGVLTAYNGSTIITSEAQLLKPHLYFRIPTSTLEELVSILEEKNADLASQMVDLEVENLMTMVALAEVYEIMMNVSMATSSTASNTKDILMTPMVGVYAKLVTAGVKTIDEVPEHLQINVTKLLKK